MPIILMVESARSGPNHLRCCGIVHRRSAQDAASSFYAPATKSIPLKTKKALYEQAAAAYIQKFPQLRPNETASLARMSLFFIASEQNKDAPEALPPFHDAVDLLISKNKADQWSALNLILELGDEHFHELHGKHGTKADHE